MLVALFIVLRVGRLEVWVEKEKGMVWVCTKLSLVQEMWGLCGMIGEVGRW